MPDERVEDHYAQSGTGREIAGRILRAAREAAGTEAAVTPELLAPFDHLHGRGVAATRELLALLEPRRGEAVLDIGCGTGGPARWIAAQSGCTVTGIDLTAAFCAAARILNEAMGMVGRVRIIEGSALALPLAEGSFDRAYSHNVLMNIADKASVYREAFRVLKPGGRLVLSQLQAGPGGPLEFPLPWAAVPENSFLATEEETRRDLAAAGFALRLFLDTSADNLAAAAALRRQIEAEGLPPAGPHVLMGPRFLRLQLNALRALEEGRTRSVVVVAEKPG